MNRMFGELGVGVGLRFPHYEVFTQKSPESVRWVEVISENFMGWQNQEIGDAHRTLLKLRRDLPVALHGVSLSVGSVDPVNFEYLRRLKELIEIIQPAIVSDHLCWTGVHGQNLHDLLPIPYTNEALDLICDKIKVVQDFLGQRILIENPSSYLEFNISEMQEWDFLNQLAIRADCGILLDINNVFVSSINHKFDAKMFLESLPVERIGQIHLAGHSRDGDLIIDTHDSPVCQEVWDLFKAFTQKHGKFSAMIERDGKIPSWEELELEIKNIWEIRGDGPHQLT